MQIKIFIDISKQAIAFFKSLKFFKKYVHFEIYFDQFLFVAQYNRKLSQQVSLIFARIYVLYA